MKSKFYKILAAFACITLLSCEKDFLDINDDPNNPFLNLVVNGTEEDVNAVEALRRKLNAWKIKAH